MLLDVFWTFFERFLDVSRTFLGRFRTTTVLTITTARLRLTIIFFNLVTAFLWFVRVAGGHETSVLRAQPLP